MRTPESLRLFLVSPDGCLARAIRAVDPSGRFEPIRFRSLGSALEKARREPGAVVIVQWMSEQDLAAEFARFDGRRSPTRWIVYCPELPGMSPLRDEEFRFALLQFGASAVFGALRELPSILGLANRHAEEHPPPPKHWTQALRDALPWK